MKRMIEDFIPWILFFLLSGKSQGQLDIAIIVAAIATLFFDYKSLRKGFILSWGTLIYFTFMLTSVALMRNQWVAQHAWLFSNGVLALIAFFSILVRKPFTMQYARELTPSEKWTHPIFIKINYILTMVWGFVFLAGIGLHLIQGLIPSVTGWVFECLTYVPSILAIWFTTRFPQWYKRRQLSLNHPST